VYLIQSGANLLFVGFFKKFLPDRTPFPYRFFHKLHQEHQRSCTWQGTSPKYPSAKCLSALRFFNCSTFHLSFAGGMKGANNRSDAPWYRELNIMNSMLNKDSCPEPFQHRAVGFFSDVFNTASCMQVFPVTSPETPFSGSFVPQPYRSRPPCRESGGLMHDK
jgi:hypothetical protein